MIISKTTSRKTAPSYASEADILSSYGSLAWLQVNRPDYPEVVKQTLDGLREEISKNRDAILGGAGA